MKVMNFKKYQLNLAVLGVMLSFLFAAGYNSFRIKQRIESLELNSIENLSLQMELMKDEIRLEREFRENQTTLQIIDVIDRHKTWLNDDHKKNMARLILSESKKYQYDPLLIVAMIMTESSFNPLACSWKGARGLMQVKPATGKAVAGEIGLKWQGIKSLHDPVFSIKSGLYYLAAQQKEFGDLKTSLAAYNYGPTAIRRRIATGKRIPQWYTKRVMQKYRKLKKGAVEVL